MLTPDMRAVIEAAHLCFAATVTPEGRPNLSPKGTIRVWDDAGSVVYDDAVRRVYGEVGPSAPVTAVVLIAVERAAPLLSPAYWHVGDETTLRAIWRQRREALDREFEAHLARVGPVRVDPAGASTHREAPR